MMLAYQTFGSNKLANHPKLRYPAYIFEPLHVYELYEAGFNMDKYGTPNTLSTIEAVSILDFAQLIEFR